MKEFFITAGIGIIVGLIDIIPMIKMKLDRHDIASAFVFYFILPFVIIHIDLYGLVWWIKGGVVGFALALPVVIMAAKEDTTSVPPMIVMSIVLGTVIAGVSHYLL